MSKKLLKITSMKILLSFNGDGHTLLLLMMVILLLGDGAGESRFEGDGNGLLVLTGVVSACPGGMK